MKRLVALCIIIATMLTGCISLNGLFSPNPEPKGKVKVEKAKEKETLQGNEGTESDTKQKPPGTKTKNR